MSKFIVKDEKYKKSLETALEESVNFLTNEIIKITPRDPKRPPEDLSRPVSGNLKRSIINQKDGELNFIIGSKHGEAGYGVYQEYGTIYIPARSFLRKGLIDNQKKVLKVFEKSLKQLM